MADHGRREGQQLGNYRLIRFLGQGNFAEVYLGQHIHLDTLAAIKVLHSQLTNDGLEDFLNEARTIAHLRHPHIVQVLDFGVEGTTPFLVMEYAPNGNLRQRHPKGVRLPIDTIVSYVKQVADALQYAHDRQLIHRDIKPENMLLGRNNEVLLSDFGIAIVAQNTRPQPGQDAAGTIAYMAPEQIKAHPGFASDQYALGVVVYEWLSGDRPFHGSLPEIATQHTLVPPPSLSERDPAIPYAVEQVVLKALAKEPGLRFAHVGAFAMALEETRRSEVSELTQPVPLPEQLATSRHVSSNNLPAPLTPLIGREQEIAAVCVLLQSTDVRLVTLTGTGGIGKTRLGLQAATELLDTFADGVFFVPLATISDPKLVIPTIAHLLGLEYPQVGPGRPMQHMEYLKVSLQDKHFLLLLDNFEQVVSAAPDLAELLITCPHLKMLVTSRAVLHMHGEHEFPVPALAWPKSAHLPEDEDLSQYPAVALFLQRALAIKPDLDITEANAQAIISICKYLEGLPLAIELAAARIKLLPPRALLQRLTNRLQVLTGGAQDVPVRHQTLRNTIAWSYNLLDAAEQRLFRRLSVFVGGCTLGAIESSFSAFEDGATQVLDGVASLIDKSMLQQIEQEAEEPRLVMLETIREYGLELLNASEEEETVRQIHAAYYLALAEEADTELGGPHQTIWLERLEREHDNLRAALYWSIEQDHAEHHVEIALRLGGALRRFWQMHGHLKEGQTFLEQALAASEGVTASKQARAKALIAAGTLASVQNDYMRAESWCQQSLILFRELGDQSGIALSLFLLGVMPWMRGDFVAARSLTEEALALFREMGEKERIAWSLSTLGLLDIQEGKYARAYTLLEESLAVHRELGDKRGIASSLVRLAHVLFVSQGDQGAVRSLLEEGLALYRELGDKDGIAYTHSLSGWLALIQGDAVTARSLLEESVTAYREMGNRRSLAESLALLARVVAAQDESTTAYALYEESLTIASVLNHTRLIASCMEGLADVVATQGEFRWAAQLLGAAEALREVINIPIPPVERADYEHSVAAVRIQLGAESFTTTWAMGRAMTPEQARAARGREIVLSQATTGTHLLTYPSGLTAREVEVLRLMTTGLTNPQIAEQLRISPVTVNSHVRSIYNKLDVTSRSAATRYAIEHHLVS
jgi:predicted ATPase/DNA-binding CsgD family transcriptional regulator